MNKHVNIQSVGEAARAARDLTLALVDRWKVGRAKQQLVWAVHNAGDNRGSIDFDGLNRMKTAEDHLAKLEPDTVAGAIAMLDVAGEILAQQSLDPEATLAEGPVLELVRNVASSLHSLSETTPLRGGVREPVADLAAAPDADGAAAPADATFWDRFLDMEDDFIEARSFAKALTLIRPEGVANEQVAAIQTVAHSALQHIDRLSTQWHSLHSDFAGNPAAA